MKVEEKMINNKMVNIMKRRDILQKKFKMMKITKRKWKKVKNNNK